MPIDTPRFSIRSYQAAGGSHVHAHAQAVLPLDGTLSLAVDGGAAHEDRVAEGTGMFVPANTLHRFRPLGDNRFVVLDFQCAVPDGTLIGIDAPLVYLLAYLRELTLRGEAPADVRANAAALLAMEVRQRLPRLPCRPESIRRALALIHARFAEPLTIDKLAAAAALSPSHLHAEFRRHMGVSPARYLADLRLRTAVERLRTSTRSIAAIALDCGFADQSALTRAMRARMGTTPGAIRRPEHVPTIP
jgi:AraC-like DNA-binding protein